MAYDHSLFNEVETFVSLCRQYNTIYIYGAAENQEFLARYLNICGIEISGLLTSKPDDRELIYEKYPRITLDELISSRDENIAVVLGLSDKYYNEVYPKLAENNFNIIFLPEYVKQVIAHKLRPRKAEEMNIEINLTAHCNLDCQMCDHFSQIAEKSFLDIATFEKDITRLAELSGGKLGAIKLLGGEPLLHPEVARFCELSRKYFPDTPIMYYTNGLLLLNPTMDGFWKACSEFNASIILTLYPIGIDIDKINERARLEKVELCSFPVDDNSSTKEIKQSVMYKLNPAGGHSLHGIVSCYQMNNCSVLSYGRLYICPMSACIGYFNSYFGQQFTVSERDYIDIHAVQTYQEIADFTSHPVPFCRYCDIGHREIYPWRRTKKTMDEYIQL